MRERERKRERMVYVVVTIAKVGERHKVEPDQKPGTFHITLRS